MTPSTLPGLLHVDHVALTVPDLDAGVAFYRDVLGAVELYRPGPFDARELPRQPDGRDWTLAHLNVESACLTLALQGVQTSAGISTATNAIPRSGDHA